MADLSELTSDLNSMKRNFTLRKPDLLKKMGQGLKRKIQNNTPIDTGRLINSYQIQATNNEAIVFSELDYAQYVNDGHTHGGTFVPGRHMFDLGIMQYESESDREVESFLESVKGVGD